MEQSLALEVLDSLNVGVEQLNKVWSAYQCSKQLQLTRIQTRIVALHKQHISTRAFNASHLSKATGFTYRDSICRPSSSKRKTGPNFHKMKGGTSCTKGTTLIHNKDRIKVLSDAQHAPLVTRCTLPGDVCFSKIL